MTEELKSLNSEEKKAPIEEHTESTKNKRSPKTSNTKWQEVKRIFFEWSKEASFECYPKIFEKQRPSLRFIWLAIFIFFSSLTFFVLFESISDYFSRETVTKIEIRHVRPLLFPTVTICDADPFTSIKSQEFFRKIALEENKLDLVNVSFKEASKKMAFTTELIKMNAGAFTREEKLTLGFNVRLESFYFFYSSLFFTFFTSSLRGSLIGSNDRS